MADEISETPTPTDDEILAAGGFTEAQVAALSILIKRALVAVNGGDSVVTVEPVPFGQMRESTPVLDAASVTTAINNETVRSVAKETEIKTRVEAVAIEAAGATDALKTELKKDISDAVTELQGAVEEVEAQASAAHRYKGVFAILDGLTTDEQKAAANTAANCITWLTTNVTQPVNGDIYVNNYNGSIFCWTETSPTDPNWVPKWVQLPSVVDLTAYYTKSEVYNKTEVEIIRTLAQKGVDDAATVDGKVASMQTNAETARGAFADAAALVALSNDDATGYQQTERINAIITLLKKANGILQAI